MGAALFVPYAQSRREEAATPPVEKTIPEVAIGGLRIACLSRSELASLMVRQCLEQRGHEHAKPKLVFAANGHAISLAATSAEFRRYHDVADLVHADGQPVVFASKFTRTPIPERSATTDFFHDAAIAARAHGLRMFVLGGSDSVNARCVEIMKEAYPGLMIVGRRHGYFTRDEEPALCEEINASGADIVWVGLSVPLEQAFCVRNRDRLRAGWLVTAGGCYNYVTGDYARAPGWMQRLGLEWLHRLWREPRRLFVRYALTNPHAMFLMLTRTASLSANAARRGPEEPRLQHGLS
jgi:N-acetylglucosaminyldiphosphoundecaprenol N-acetyl-beta-D-mannosaminyltransferase